MRPRIVYLLLPLIVLIWGTTWLAIRVVLKDLPGWQSIGWRFLIAGLCLFAWVRAQGIPIRFDRRACAIHLFLTVCTYVGTYGCVYYGQRTVPSGLASVIFATMPFYVVLLGPLLVRERLTVWKLAGLVLGIAGILAIHRAKLEDQPIGFNQGLLALSAAPVFTALGNLVLKRIAVRENAIALNVPPMLYGAAVFFVLAFLFDDPSRNRHTPRLWSTLLYLSTIGTAFVFTAYFVLLRHLPVTRLSFTAFVTPVVAVLAGWLVEGERLSLEHLVGAALVLAGVAVSGMPYRAPPRPTRAADSADERAGPSTLARETTGA